MLYSASACCGLRDRALSYSSIAAQYMAHTLHQHDACTNIHASLSRHEIAEEQPSRFGSDARCLLTRSSIACEVITGATISQSTAVAQRQHGSKQPHDKAVPAAVSPAALRCTPVSVRAMARLLRMVS